LEERPAVELPPGDAVAHTLDRGADLRARRVRSHFLEETQAVDRGHPALVVAGAPMPFRRLQSKKLGAPAFAGDARPLGCDVRFRRIGQVAEHLPSDRGIRIEEPFHNRISTGHAFLCSAAGKAGAWERAPRSRVGTLRFAHPTMPPYRRRWL